MSHRRGLGNPLAIALIACLANSYGTPALAQTPHFDCGRDFLIEREIVPIPSGLLVQRAPVEGVEQAATATIVLNAGAGLTANPAALAAWQSAVAIWESWLEDNVTVTLAGDLVPLGAGILGSTSSRTFLSGYASIRGAVVADAAADEVFIANLPTQNQFNTFLNLHPTLTYNHQLSATKANLRALGFDMSFDDPFPDASISFNSALTGSFDFDPSDGIGAGLLDFEAIVVHEIGHALGFVSEVDYVDFLVANAFTDEVTPSTLDLFRFQNNEGSGNFTFAGRVQNDGATVPIQKTWNGIANFAMSTGVSLGDGRQASHWKADELTGTFIGIMDPTLAAGDREVIAYNDIRAFGIIGWDVAEDCNENGVPDSDDIALGNSLDCNANNIPDDCDIASGSSLDCNFNNIPDDCETDCNSNGIPDQCDIALGGIPDCNSNGIPDECDITAGTSLDCNNNSIPDECDISTSASLDVNSDQIPDECQSLGVGDDPQIKAMRIWAAPNPFSPETQVRFELPEAAHVTIEIYDARGRRVAALANREFAPGSHVQRWDGNDEGGRRAAAGIYYLSARLGNETRLVKLTLLR